MPPSTDTRSGSVSFHHANLGVEGVVPFRVPVVTDEGAGGLQGCHLRVGDLHACRYLGVSSSAWTPSPVRVVTAAMVGTITEIRASSTWSDLTQRTTPGQAMPQASAGGMQGLGTSKTSCSTPCTAPWRCTPYRTGDVVAQRAKADDYAFGVVDFVLSAASRSTAAMTNHHRELFRTAG